MRGIALLGYTGITCPIHAVLCVVLLAKRTKVAGHATGSYHTGSLRLGLLGKCRSYSLSEIILYLFNHLLKGEANYSILVIPILIILLRAGEVEHKAIRCLVDGDVFFSVHEDILAYQIFTPPPCESQVMRRGAKCLPIRILWLGRQRYVLSRLI